jgi:hypothetical protein
MFFFSRHKKPVAFHEEIPCPIPSTNLKIVVTFGQSNSANYGGMFVKKQRRNIDHYQPVGDVRVLHWKTGKCFVGNDPVVGASGDGASLWGRFGDELIAQKKATQVLIVAFGVGGTSIREWVGEKATERDGENLAERLETAASTLRRAGYTADMVAFQQGESDPDISYHEYRSRLEKLGERVYQLFQSPMVTAVSTLCQRPAHAGISRAIHDAVADHPAIRLGPSFDKDVAHVLDRTDQCHLSGIGLDKGARFWAELFK